jgi:hypothetical protein
MLRVTVLDSPRSDQTADAPMSYEIRLHCAPFPPTDVRGDERRVCVVAERIIRDMEAAGRFVVVRHLRSSGRIEAYLDGVQCELRRCPPPRSKVRSRG